MLLHNDPISRIDLLGLIEDPEWPKGKLSDPENLKKLGDAMENWRERVRQYLAACKNKKNDKGHFDKLGEKCGSAEKYLRRLNNALADPNLPNRELVEAARDALQQIYNDYCPTRDKLPLPETQVCTADCPAKENIETAAAWVALYWIVSEATRLIPFRNLIPVP